MRIHTSFVTPSASDTSDRDACAARSPLKDARARVGVDQAFLLRLLDDCGLTISVKKVVEREELRTLERNAVFDGSERVHVLAFALEATKHFASLA